MNISTNENNNKNGVTAKMRFSVDKKTDIHNVEKKREKELRSVDKNTQNERQR